MSESVDKNIADQIRELHNDVTFELQKRERPDRHPYQTGCLVGLLIVSTAQIIIGLPPQSALYEVTTRATLTALNTPFIVGSFLCLWGAALSRDRHFHLSLRLGIFGHLSLFAAAVSYSFIVIVATNNPGSKPYWLAVTSVGLGIGIAYAAVVRFFQMRKLLKESERRNLIKKNGG